MWRNVSFGASALLSCLILLGTASGADQPVVLGEPTSATQLKGLMTDSPDTIRVVDIRPADQFADYHLPGSENVSINELMRGSEQLADARQLVVVDRDGSVALMVAGILSQRSARPVRALYGGLQRYWDEVGVGAAARGGTPVAAPPASSSGRAVPVRPKRRSAGC